MNDRIQKILDILSEEFPEPKSELQYASVFQLLVAVILSAVHRQEGKFSYSPAF